MLFLKPTQKPTFAKLAKATANEWATLLQILSKQIIICFITPLLILESKPIRANILMITMSACINLNEYMNVLNYISFKNTLYIHTYVSVKSISAPYIFK